MPRCYVACDRCDFGVWIGPEGDLTDAWCEACQRGAQVPSGGTGAPRCEGCGEPLTIDEPRFEELWGEVQNLAAVLEAWQGGSARIAPLVPERPPFLTDLNPPPATTDDPPAVREALGALAAGAFRDARAALERQLEPGAARRALALGVACQRLGDLEAAERAFSRALEDAPNHPAARLNRGVLRARRGDFAGAEADLGRAGNGLEARWNRAALRVLDAVATRPGLPAPEVVRAAREEAGPPSSHWSDHTVGRLLFTLLAERARGRSQGDAVGWGDERELRAAERELEFDTFTDRAMVLHAYASLGMRGQAEEVARPLTLALVEWLGAQPFVRGPLGLEIRTALNDVARAVGQGDPAAALAAAAALGERRDLARYRIPCARCGEGTLGVDRLEDPVVAEEPA